MSAGLGLFTVASLAVGAAVLAPSTLSLLSTSFKGGPDRTRDDGLPVLHDAISPRRDTEPAHRLGREALAHRVSVSPAAGSIMLAVELVMTIALGRPRR
jgi:hypothetical protein